MKLRLSLAILVALSLTGCGSESNSAVVTEAAVEAVPEVAVVEAAIEVNPEVLAADLKSLGCYACHAIEKKRVGPSYRAVAQRYRDQSDVVPLLVAKVINGGGGVWGPIPMVTHPHLKSEQLTPLIERILQLPAE
ncbi:MAG: hypothetical protein JKY89_08090 [Immundisolibacteraceae bacterium]|nr:hypothetical protein [Immundisolibacteraceae bacterium]